MLNIFPSKKEFIRQAEKSGKFTPVCAELPFMPPRRAFGPVESPGCFLFESIKGPEKIARYSFIGAEPFMIFRAKNGVVETISGDRKFRSAAHPLKMLKELLGVYPLDAPEGLPPFAGGAAGIISYDFVHYLERLPRTAVDDLGIPDAHFMLVDTVAAFDRKLRKTFLISCPGARQILTGYGEAAGEPGMYYDEARGKIDNLYKKLASGISASGPIRREPSPPARGTIEIRHEMRKKDYMDMVKRAKEYIRAGDIFQANLSQRVSACIGDTTAWHIYRLLSGINPSPFAAYMNMGDYCIASSSPERLVKVSGGIVETRPIAGTRPRGADAEDDSRMRNELLLNEKERAEHLMLIDLERNDLGRISDYGSVEVDELMITEDYSHVIHIVSNIRGSVSKGRDCFDAIRAAFPGGTITGVPKVRCMEIIDELEPVARGPYTGSAGYISFTGAMDLNIIIRTFVIKDGMAYVQAGAGIVADSDPEREYYETLKKAEALIKTLGIL